MLKNSKLIYFIKRLFTFVDEKNKLDIIKYNKNIQNILDISFINYKFFSDRYIIFEKNGKGKEYNKYDKLLFKGEYLNGKRNGKGKEYFIDGNLKFEGEYLNGKRNGKGTDYYFDGILRFEGEYLNGNSWNGNGYNPDNNIVYSLKDGNGLIKEYYDSNLIFEGEYLNGKRNGKGKEYDNNGNLIFEGDYLYNHKLKGKYYINNNLEYEGEYIYNKKWNGKGYDENGNIIYELINGTGKVKEYDPDFGDLKFEGVFIWC